MRHRVPFVMPFPITIISAHKDADDGVLIGFSDGTTAGYVAEELLELRPVRELIDPDIVE